MISECIDKELDPEQDRILIFKPNEHTRNTQHNELLYCLINKDRKVALKRCSDNSEYLRRELVIDSAKRALNLPRYTIKQESNVSLTLINSKQNCSLLSGWENKKFLVIDYGHPNLLKPLSKLKKEEIHPETFFYSYGSWTAFNLIFGVRDRHLANFVLCISDDILHSVDNEEGFFDNHKQLVPIRVMINQTISTIRHFVDEENSIVFSTCFERGFKNTWEQIKNNISNLIMFTESENELITEILTHDPDDMIKLFSV